MRLPLSATFTNALNWPAISTCSTGQRAWTAKALPDRFLQSRQWHTDTRTGSPVAVARSWPQRHEALRVVTFWSAAPAVEAPRAHHLDLSRTTITGLRLLRLHLRSLQNRPQASANDHGRVSEYRSSNFPTERTAESGNRSK